MVDKSLKKFDASDRDVVFRQANQMIDMFTRKDAEYLRPSSAHIPHADPGTCGFEGCLAKHNPSDHTDTSVWQWLMKLLILSICTVAKML